VKALLSPIRMLYEWTVGWAGTPHGAVALFAISFAESSFFPVPPDVLQIALSLGNPDMAFWYAAISTLASTLGGCLGYAIGYWGGRPLIERLVGHGRVDLVHQYFQRYEGWAVGIAGFTPIPYKVFTLGAGIFYVNFRVFVVASALSRGARFFLVASLLYLFGPPIRTFIEANFEWLTVGVVAGVLGGFLIVKRVAPRLVGGRGSAGRRS
jgi:membrane protein YqaA with SNARE-associated domain